MFYALKICGYTHIGGEYKLQLAAGIFHAIHIVPGGTCAQLHLELAAGAKEIGVNSFV